MSHWSKVRNCFVFSSVPSAADSDHSTSVFSSISTWQENRKTRVQTKELWSGQVLLWNTDLRGCNSWERMGPRLWDTQAEEQGRTNSSGRTNTQLSWWAAALCALVACTPVGIPLQSVQKTFWEEWTWTFSYCFCSPLQNILGYGSSVPWVLMETVV